MSTPNRALAVVRNEQEAAELAPAIAARFPRDCTPAQALDIARIALAYELDPLMEEIIPFQGRPYVTIPGRVRIADKHPEYDGYDHGPVSQQEREALQPAPGEALWKCIVYRRDRSHPLVAYGRAGGPGERNAVARQQPVDMAMKRAIHRALRSAFPIPIPGIEEAPTAGQIRAIHAVDDDAGVSRQERHAALEATYGVSASNELTSDQASAYLDARAVDAETGEITDDRQDEVDGIDEGADLEPSTAAPRQPDATAVQQQIDADWGAAIDGAAALSEAVGIANQIRQRYGAGHPLTKRAGERVTELSRKKAQP